MLEVKGRKSGEWRQTPVNPLPFEGNTYLVAPRGHTQWVRNLRVSGEGRLVSRGTETFTATELRDEEKPALLRAYLKKWKWEVGPSSTESERTPPTPSCSGSPRTTRSSASPPRPRGPGTP